MYSEALASRGQQESRRNWLQLFVVALVAVLATILSSATAAAATTTGPENRVRASAQDFTILVGASDRVTPGQQLGNNPAYAKTTVATGVAAKNAGGVADIGHAGVRHQFPTTFPKRSQFYDDIDLGSLSSRTKGLDGIVQQNGNTRYVLRNPGGVGVDRATGLPTDVFTVIRGKDGSVVTMFPGTTKLG
jgi:hypothetical protein